MRKLLMLNPKTSNAVLKNRIGHKCYFDPIKVLCLFSEHFEDTMITLCSEYMDTFIRACG
jgi:hypothetical protein